VAAALYPTCPRRADVPGGITGKSISCLDGFQSLLYAITRTPHVAHFARHVNVLYRLNGLAWWLHAAARTARCAAGTWTRVLLGVFVAVLDTFAAKHAGLTATPPKRCPTGTHCRRASYLTSTGSSPAAGTVAGFVGGGLPRLPILLTIGIFLHGTPFYAARTRAGGTTRYLPPAGTCLFKPTIFQCPEHGKNARTRIRCAFKLFVGARAPGLHCATRAQAAHYTRAPSFGDRHCAGCDTAALGHLLYACAPDAELLLQRHAPPLYNSFPDVRFKGGLAAVACQSGYGLDLSTSIYPHQRGISCPPPCWKGMNSNADNVSWDPGYGCIHYSARR